MRLISAIIRGIRVKEQVFPAALVLIILAPQV